jgi:HEAT repeat protein
MRSAALSLTALLSLAPVATAQTVYGPRQIVNLTVTNVADELHEEAILKRLPKLIGGKYLINSSSKGHTLSVSLAPVDDPVAFAKKIDFGEVGDINGRSIRVLAHSVGKPGTTPDPVARALEALKMGNKDARRIALSQLAKLEPTRRKAEVARAVEPHLRDSDQLVKERAIDAIGVWGTADNVPALVRELDGQWVGPRRAAVKALGKLKDPAAIAPIARRLSDSGDTSDVVRALTTFGRQAEPVALATLAGKDTTARAGACEVLKAIGTKKAVAPLTAAAEDADPRVRRKAAEALRAVKGRLL